MLSARVIVCTLALLLCSAAGIAGLVTGRVITRSQPIAKSEHPVLFWATEGMYAAVAAVALEKLLWG